METIVCKHHGEQKAMKYKSYKGKPRYRCQVCISSSVTRTRKRLKQEVVDLAGGKCQICGYDTYLGALVFHHKDPTQKDFMLSMRNIAKAKEEVLKEAAKCALLCANCHAEVHAGVVEIADQANLVKASV